MRGGLRNVSAPNFSGAVRQDEGENGNPATETTERTEQD